MPKIRDVLQTLKDKITGKDRADLAIEHYKNVVDPAIQAGKDLSAEFDLQIDALSKKFKEAGINVDKDPTILHLKEVRQKLDSAVSLVDSNFNNLKTSLEVVPKVKSRLITAPTFKRIKANIQAKIESKQWNAEVKRPLEQLIQRQSQIEVDLRAIAAERKLNAVQFASDKNQLTAKNGVLDSKEESLLKERVELGAKAINLESKMGITTPAAQNPYFISEMNIKSGQGDLKASFKSLASLTELVKNEMKLLNKPPEPENDSTTPKPRR